jgi:membrane associated rhomboid family serine protease
MVWELSLPPEVLRAVFWVFGMMPASIMARDGAGAIASITSTFMHVDIFHLVSNMLFLWVFGRRVEDACGPLRFLLYYLMAGTTAGLLTTAILPDMEIPGIGASGAISGIMGAYLLLFPAGRIRTLVFIFIVPTWPRIRAAWFLLYYLIIQIPPAIDIYLNGANYGVGYWAHLGGFFACFFVLLFLRPEAFARYLSDVPV